MTIVNKCILLLIFMKYELLFLLIKEIVISEFMVPH